MAEFFDEDALKDELDSLLENANGNLDTLFDWFDNPCHDWQYGSQKQFLAWACSEMEKQGEILSPAAIRKKYQRHQLVTPEQKLLKSFKKANAEKRKETELLNCLFFGNFDYQAPVEDPCFIMPWHRKAIELFNYTQEKMRLLCHVNEGYVLRRNDISARGIWINSKMAQELWELTSAGIDFAEAVPLTSVDLLRAERGAGCFIVYKDSQMVKTSKPFVAGHEKVDSKRKELIESKVVEERDGIYVFQENYAFSSPSSAASVLLGINVNGQVYWRDSRGKTFRALHPNFDKIKRGPGRPKKSS